MDKNEALSIGEVAQRSGLSVPAVRFYEERGLIPALRTRGNQRRFPRHVLRRIAMIRAGQRFGLSLAEIGQAMANLPQDRAPSKRDWTRVSRAWHDALTERIEALVAVRDGASGCIGCGCLSLASCPISNHDDELAKQGPGPRRLPQGARD